MITLSQSEASQQSGKHEEHDDDLPRPPDDLRGPRVQVEAAASQVVADAVVPVVQLRAAAAPVPTACAAVVEAIAAKTVKHS